MYEMTKRQIQDLVYQNTPIDQILVVNEDRRFIEVTGRAGKDVMTYRFYENGSIVEK